MAKYLSFKILIQISLISSTFFMMGNGFALAGKQIDNQEETSSEIVVRHVLDLEHPPFVHLTPSRPTIVQFPSEVSNCTIKSDLVAITYGNGVGTSQSTQNQSQPSDKTSTKKGENSALIYSAVTLSVKSLSNFNYEDLLNTPETYMICSIVSNPSDTFCEAYSDQQNTYCYVTVAVRISEPNLYNAIVYLDKPGSPSALAPFPEKKLSASKDKWNKIDKKKNELNSKFENLDPVIIPSEEKRDNSLLVKKEKTKKEDEFKLEPLPRSSFVTDRILGIKADSKLN